MRIDLGIILYYQNNLRIAYKVISISADYIRLQYTVNGQDHVKRVRRDSLYLYSNSFIAHNKSAFNHEGRNRK